MGAGVQGCTMQRGVGAEVLVMQYKMQKYKMQRYKV